MIIMSAQESRRNLMNILIVALVAVVIIAAYLIYSNAPVDTIEELTVDEVVESSDQYLDSKIIVKGYYYHGNYPEGQGYITSELEDDLTNPKVINRLLIDHSALNASETPLQNEVTYYFTGLLQYDEDSPLTSSIILVVEKIEAV